MTNTKTNINSRGAGRRFSTGTDSIVCLLAKVAAYGALGVLAIRILSVIAVLAA